MLLWEEFQRSSPVVKVIVIVLLVLIVAFFCCGSWFLLQAIFASPATPTSGVVFVTVTPGSGPTAAPTPVVFNGWRGEYFDNPELEGEPVLVRDDDYINFDWGDSSPGPGVPAQNFSVRWTIERDVPAGPYRFTANFDHGMRVWLDDRLVIDKWQDGPVRTARVDVNVAAGPHNVRVEYYHLTGPAVAQLKVEDLQKFSGLKAEYFDQPNFNNPPVVVRNEEEINYNWGQTSPIPGLVPDNNFAVRWSRTAYTDEGTYLFRIYVEGGVRFWIDGQIVLDSWDENQFRQVETEYALSQGDHGFKIEYVKETGNGQISTYWVQLQEPDEPPLAVIRGPIRAQVGQPASFTARFSSAAEGSRLASFDWDLGEGTKASGIDVSHVYQDTGVYEVKLTVTDDKGLGDTSTQKVEIVAVPVTPEPDQPPIPVINAPSKAEVGQTIIFDAGQSVCANICISYAWELGDGTKYNAIKVQHVYLAPATYNVVLTVSDDKGLQSTTNKQIKIREADLTPEPTPEPTPGPTDEPTPEPTVEPTTEPEAQPLPETPPPAEE